MRRWRPSLALVVGGALAGTLTLSFVGLVAFRYLGPEIGFRKAALVLGALILAGTGVLGALLRRLLMRPIRALEDYAAAVRAGGAPPPPGHFGTSELHRTATSVIDMARTLQDREATVRAYSDHVTHEIRTPVSAIRASVELIEDGDGLSEGDARLLAEIDGAARQVEGQLQALAAAARARETRHLGRCRLADLLPLEQPGLAVRAEGQGVAIPLGAEGLRMVLGQLARNASEHGATTLRLVAAESGGAVVLEVSDDGAGVSPGNAEHLFEPFFTTRRAEGGTGMGLTIARNVLAAHGGTIALVPSGSGARFEIRFPEGRAG
jgi:two-component system OmpR family sensor kinase